MPDTEPSISFPDYIGVGKNWFEGVPRPHLATSPQREPHKAQTVENWKIGARNGVEMISILLDEIGMTTDSITTAVDLCCGHGFWMPPLLEIFPNLSAIYGIDYWRLLPNTLLTNRRIHFIEGLLPVALEKLPPELSPDLVIAADLETAVFTSPVELEILAKLVNKGILATYGHTPFEDRRLTQSFFTIINKSTSGGTTIWRKK